MALGTGNDSSLSFRRPGLFSVDVGHAVVMTLQSMLPGKVKDESRMQTKEEEEEEWRKNNAI